MQIYGEFHKTFSGANADTFKVCKDCEGMCEYSKIGTLLPGEKEYMAKEMGISVTEFKLRFLDILRFDDGTQLYLLKLEKLCPFLNEETKNVNVRNSNLYFVKYIL